MSRLFEVKKSFSYSSDGINVSRLEEGEVLVIKDDLISGLTEAGFIAPFEEEPAAKVDEEDRPKLATIRPNNAPRQRGRAR